MAKRSRPPSPPRRLLDVLTSRLGRRLLAGLALALLFLGVGAGMRQARARALALDAYRIGPADLRFVGLPEAIDEPLLSALHDPRRLPFSFSVFDPAAEAKVADALARHPLVGEVRAVRVRFPGRAPAGAASGGRGGRRSGAISAHVRLRVPVAWFETVAPGAGRAPGYVLVSQDARVLDPEPWTGWLARLPGRLPVVRGVRARAPAFVGQAWEDPQEQVAEALRGVQVGRRLAARGLGLAVVDVSGVSSRAGRRGQGLVLHLEAGPAVTWGETDRPQRVTREGSDEIKLRRLERALRAARGRERALDVRFPDESESPLPLGR